jgi:parallel beta-helix repeat protein
VHIRTGGSPTLRRNRINRNDYEAVWVYEGGRGMIEDNDLTGNKRGPWDIAEDSKANVQRSGNRERSGTTVIRQARQPSKQAPSHSGGSGSR